MRHKPFRPGVVPFQAGTPLRYMAVSRSPTTAMAVAHGRKGGAEAIPHFATSGDLQPEFVRIALHLAHAVLSAARPADSASNSGPRSAPHANRIISPCSARRPHCWQRVPMSPLGGMARAPAKLAERPLQLSDVATRLSWTPRPRPTAEVGRFSDLSRSPSAVHASRISQQQHNNGCRATPTKLATHQAGILSIAAAINSRLIR